MIEYRGEVISQNLSLERMEGIYKNNKNFYFLEYEKGEVVDACRKGTNARFVNHRYVAAYASELFLERIEHVEAYASIRIFCLFVGASPLY